MKKLLVVLMMVFGFFITNAESNPPEINIHINVSSFCEGWKDGYEEGFCYGKGYGCIKPITPICPIPRIGEDDYKGGYNRGFLQGLNNR